MSTIQQTIKPVAALALSALLGALFVLSAIATLGGTTHASGAASSAESRALHGISRYNTTDIRALPLLRR